MLRRVLVVNPYGIGDVLFTTPLLDNLRVAFPQAKISYLANARTAVLLAGDPRIDKVFVYERDAFVAVWKKSPLAFLRKWQAFILSLRAEQVEVAFDLSMGPPLGLAVFLAGIPRRIGFDYKGRGRWLTDKQSLQGYEGRYVAEFVLDLLRFLDPCINVHKTEPSLFLPVEEEVFAENFLRQRHLARYGYMVVYPGGGASWGQGAGLKRWSAENFAKMADIMIEKGACPVILMGDTSEMGLCTEVSQKMRNPVINAAGLTTLRQAAVLARFSRFVLANDGGPLHVAAAAGARTVGIFGPVDPAVYGAYPDQKHKVVVKGLACQPCYRNFRMSNCGHRSCLTTLTPDDVFNVIKEWL